MNDAVACYRLAELSNEQRSDLLVRAEDDLSDFLEKVDPIIEAVRTEGDHALARFAREFEDVPLQHDQIAATSSDFSRAFDQLDNEMIEVLEYAADNIRRYHEEQKPGDIWMKEIRPGVLVGERFTPIDSVACYSPRGKGSFPSVTLMTSLPAIVAGVKQTIIVTPAGPDGHVDAATLVAARIAGVDQVYKAGGAQAVAAVAFGTDTVPACKKIVGPGSPWFVAGRQRLQHVLDTGLPAGPSEVIVLADESANAAIAALDVIIESEHGPDSSAFLVTWSEDVAEQARQRIPQYWEHMSEGQVAHSSAVLGGPRGGIVIAQDAASAYDFINDYAPEHLQILSQHPYEHLAHIRNASEILLGEHAAGSIANYMMGPNCVLPTSGAAHTRSPLGVHDYMKSCSIAHMTKTGFDEMAPKTHRFATYEGFDAHANAVSSLRTDAFNEGADLKSTNND